VNKQPALPGTLQTPYSAAFKKTKSSSYYPSRADIFLGSTLHIIYVKEEDDTMQFVLPIITLFSSPLVEKGPPVMVITVPPAGEPYEGVIESIYELTSTGGKSEVLMSPNTL
jgi:hypothetical protein